MRFESDTVQCVFCMCICSCSICVSASECVCSCFSVCLGSVLAGKYKTQGHVGFYCGTAPVLLSDVPRAQR